MRLAGLLIGALLLVTTSSPGQATVRIKADPGGQIGPHLAMLLAWRSSGQRIIIDGPCLSACTMLLGVIPRERICVTPRARLGFHAAWRPGENGREVTNDEATRLLMEIYPAHVRSWITRNGGLSRKIIFLGARELAEWYQTCN